MAVTAMVRPPRPVVLIAGEVLAGAGTWPIVWTVGRHHPEAEDGDEVGGGDAVSMDDESEMAEASE